MHREKGWADLSMEDQIAKWLSGPKDWSVELYPTGLATLPIGAKLTGGGQEWHGQGETPSAALNAALRRFDGQSAKLTGEERGALAAILIRTIHAEAVRTGSWAVPIDIQQRILNCVEGCDPDWGRE